MKNSESETGKQVKSNEYIQVINKRELWLDR